MDRAELIKALQTDVEIPEVVQDKAKAAFDKIRAAGGEEINRKEEHLKKESIKKEGRGKGTGTYQEYHGQLQKKNVKRKENSENMKKMQKKKLAKKKGFSAGKAAVLFLAAALACGSITTVAAYLRWSRSLEEGMQVTEEQKVQLEEEQAVAFAMQECTKQGVKITAEQSITDNYFSYIVFRVEGYELAEGAEPAFERMDVSVDGKDDFNYTASFYDGLVTGPDGKAANADGSPLEEDEYGNIGHMVMKDGSMEYVVMLHSDVRGYFVDKDIHVELHNLGTVAKAEYLGSAIEDTWTFDWNLKGKDSMEEYRMQELLGDSGATVKKVELSPVSVYVEYDFPRQTVTEEGVNENGESISSDFFEEPPMFMGVKMKDGTLYPWLQNGGSMGYGDGNTDTYLVNFAFDRVIDLEQVESLLFQKEDVMGTPTEGNFYVVPLP